jgi:hypothetical protein
MFTAKETLRQNKRHQLDSYVICWDCIKCFGRLPREFTWKSTRKVGVNEEMIAAVQATLMGTTCQLNVEGETRQVQMRQGSAQGTSLRPTPCLYFFLPILKLWVKRQQGNTPTTKVDVQEDGRTIEVGTGINNFADDTMMVVTSEQEVTRITREFVACIETFQVKMHASNTATPTKPSKSVIVFTPATCKPNAPLKRPTHMRTAADGTHDTICHVRSCVCLGATINEKMCDVEEIDKRMLKGTQLVKTMLLPCIYTKLVLCGLLRQCKSLAAQARSGRFRITPGYSYVRASAARWCI